MRTVSGDTAIYYFENYQINKDNVLKTINFTLFDCTWYVTHCANYLKKQWNKTIRGVHNHYRDGRFEALDLIEKWCWGWPHVKTTPQKTIPITLEISIEGISEGWIIIRNALIGNSMIILKVPRFLIKLIYVNLYYFVKRFDGSLFFRSHH